MAHNTMGAVFRPKDLPAGWRKRMQESIKDLSPDTKDRVLKIIDSWEDTKSEQKLKEMLGHDKAENLMKNIRTTSKSTLTYEQQKQVKDMFRDSLTFD
jgi:3-methyladenine DNA glycosylase AlkC